MTAPEFIHLRVHSAYSLLEGAIPVDKLAKATAAQKIPAVAITDSGNIFGAMSFAKEALKCGVQPIFGTQLLVKMPPRDDRPHKEEFGQVVLLVQNQTGYLNLLSHFHSYYMGADKQPTPHLSFDELLTKTDGLLALTGGVEGLVGKALLAGRPAEAERLLLRLKEAYPGRVYMEIQRHGLENELLTEEGFLELAYRHAIPLVATNEAFFDGPDMYEAHDALICIAEKTYVAEGERRRLTPEHRLKTPAEMKALFADLPEAAANTVSIAKRCAFCVEKKPTAFPNYDCQGKTEDELLAELAVEGLEKRMRGRSAADAERYRERLTSELGIIRQMGFSGYFLIVADFIQWSKANGVAVGPGRGSGAGSVVAWSLTITELDPIRFNLLFERFLNPERVSLPDFDIDFCQENRQRTIEYVRRKYGHDYVAQIITFGKLQAKAVIRDVGRVLQIPYPVVDRLSKLVPNTLGITLEDAIAQEPEFAKEAQRDESIAYLLEIARKLEGLYRNASTHAAGVVIGSRPLEELVPLYKDPASDMPVTQFNMKFVEDTGLIKFDFLGLKTLTTIDKTIELLRRQGIELPAPIDNLPLDDAQTFELLRSANTLGVFQLESSGMRKVLYDMQPDVFEDIIALVSLYRPGPMESIPSYIARKRGTEKPDYMHPLLEPILKETYGIMIYQEQVMQISQVMASYTLGAADLLRRAMGKKIKEEMEKQRSVFISGAQANNIPKAVAENVFDKMAKFAEYGFNKSHAAAYAYIAYQTAYLKAHYPVEFMAATMTLDKINTDKLAIFRNNLRTLNIELLPPDINLSDVNFNVENGKIRYALAAVKNVGEAAMQAVVAERARGGKYRSVADLLKRVDVGALNKRSLENLIKAGAFDALHASRAELLANAEKLVSYAAQATEAKKSAQISLFGGASEASPLKLDKCAPWPALERLNQEAEALGFYLSAHPLDSFGAVCKRLRVVSSADVPALVRLNGPVCVLVAGIVSQVRERISQKGNKFAFITASDKGGTYDMMCFADVLYGARDKLKSGQPLLFTITAEKRPDAEEVRLSLQKAELLAEVMERTESTVFLTLGEKADPAQIKHVLAQDKKGKSRLFVTVSARGHQVEIALDEKYALSLETVEALRRLPDVELTQA